MSQARTHVSPTAQHPTQVPAPPSVPPTPVPPVPASVGPVSARTSAAPEVKLEIRSNPLYLSGAREMVSAVAKRLGFSDESCSQMALAVDEALCNVIRHGYDRHADRPIWISLWPEGMPSGTLACGPVHTAASASAVEEHGGGFGAGACCAIFPEALRIVIEDEAKQVDPKTIKSRDLEEIRPGGLGVHIIKAVMDEVSYERREKTGMRLTMVKRRSSPARRLGSEEVASGGCTPGVDARTGSVSGLGSGRGGCGKERADG